MTSNTFNPWHHVDHGFDEATGLVQAIIEIPKNSRAKYELDKESGLIKLDRVIYSSMYYPANYGFIPQSYCDDKDPLDILVLSQIEMVPLCLVKAKVIGVMRMLDRGEEDDKIIAVAADDPGVNHVGDIHDLPAHFISELRNFFEEYKKLEQKEVVVEDFSDRILALQIVRDSFALYSRVIRPDVKP